MLVGIRLATTINLIDLKCVCMCACMCACMSVYVIIQAELFAEVMTLRMRMQAGTLSLVQ